MTHDTLITREHQILSLMCDGLTRAQIARTLYIVPSTVGTYTTRIFTKLSVCNSTQAVAHAFKSGLVRVNGVAK